MPDDVTGEELDVDARVELRTLPKELAAKVARHLVMAGRLAEDEPEQSYKHAKAARRLASRVGIVREAAGIAAYHAGEWAEALAELRAARRLGAGDDSYLPVMVDCERGLGRPERALDLIKSSEAEKLDPMGRVELRIVESGVRRDMGQYDAAVVALQIPELRDRRLRPWSMRLFYAYADALVEVGRGDEAADWFARASAADRDGDTDAAERYAELEGLHILDTEEGEAGAAGIADGAIVEEGDMAEEGGVAGDVFAGGLAADDVVVEEVGAADDGGVVDEAPADDVAAGHGVSDEGGVVDDVLAGGVAAGEGATEENGVAGDVVAGGVLGEELDIAEDGSVEEGGVVDEAPADDVTGGGAEPEPEPEAGGVAAEAGGVGGDLGGAEGGDVEAEGLGDGEVGSEPAAPTDIAFKAAEPELRDAPDEDVPEVPAVFLEPKPADEERPPQGE